jgi:hypothetical protein
VGRKPANPHEYWARGLPTLLKKVGKCPKKVGKTIFSTFSKLFGQKQKWAENKKWAEIWPKIDLPPTLFSLNFYNSFTIGSSFFDSLGRALYSAQVSKQLQILSVITYNAENIQIKVKNATNTL